MAAINSFSFGGSRLPVARKALGLIETRGLVAAIEAADAMCKTADVELARYEVTKAALVSILVRGPLAAVESAVDAGAAAAQRFGEVTARHVIPSPEPQLEGVMLDAGHD